MRPPEVLESQRLIMRRPRTGDAEAMFENYARDPEVSRYLTWTPARSLEETRELMPVFVDAWASDGPSFPWVITIAGSDEAVGMIEARVNGTSVELGYVISRSQWGRGYMPEAVEAVADWAFGTGGIWRLWALVDVDNHGSCRVLEKVGMTKEGVLHRWGVHPNVSDTPRDVCCYARWRIEA